ncbi:MAG: patatin-like phospholipase family protein [Candidatus Tumulicola sp.]
MERRSFLLALGVAGLAAPLLGGSAAAQETLEPFERALVLSGGGARGVYEAGIVGAMAAADGVNDGAPLPAYDLVCGTSIGALNGWFVATGQYSKLRELWYGISGQDIVRPKQRYAAVKDPQSGILNRAASAVSLIGLAKDQRGLLQSEPVYDWISRNVDPSTPLVMPLVWATTNLSMQRPEYFYLRPHDRGNDLPGRVVHALQLTLGPQTIVREATPELLHRAIFASAALPIAFDPVIMPDAQGNPSAYCDGGVASNSPVGVAHAVSKAADVVLMDPPFEADTDYKDAVEIAFGVFGTMQRKILEVEMRNAYFQSIGKRALMRLTETERARTMNGMEQVAKFMQTVPETTLRYIRPKTTLPLGVVGFDDEVGIGKAYRTGWLDVANPGFTAYDWQTFEL